MNPAAHASPPPRSQWAIETRGLTRRYGDLVAVDALELRVAPGTFLALLGTNGAGKTTTLRMLTGLLAPTSGDALIDGLSIRDQPLEIKRRIGVVPDDLALFEQLSFWEHLTLVGRIHGFDAPETARRAQDLLDLLEIADARDLDARDASTGMRKKLAVAMALLPRPSLLFLDEPFESIDPFVGRTLRDLLAALARSGVTIVLTTHILEVVERLAERVAILAQGRLAFHGSVAELQTAGKSVEEAFRTAAGRGGDAPRDLPWLF